MNFFSCFSNPSSHVQQQPQILESKTKIGNNQFCLKVLTAVLELQLDSYNEGDGINTSSIVDKVQEKFYVDGDVNVQVCTSLQRLLNLGLVYQFSNSKYKLIGPLANVVSTCNNTQERTDEAFRIMNVFWNSLKGNKRGNIYTTSNSESEKKIYFYKPKRFNPRRRNVKKRLRIAESVCFPFKDKSCKFLESSVEVKKVSGRHVNDKKSKTFFGNAFYERHIEENESGNSCNCKKLCKDDS